MLRWWMEGNIALIICDENFSVDSVNPEIKTLIQLKKNSTRCSCCVQSPLPRTLGGSNKNAPLLVQQFSVIWRHWNAMTALFLMMCCSEGLMTSAQNQPSIGRNPAFDFTGSQPTADKNAGISGMGGRISNKKKRPSPPIAVSICPECRNPPPANHSPPDGIKMTPTQRSRPQRFVQVQL